AASIVQAGFELNDLESAVQTALAAYPESVGVNNFATVIACLRQDHAAAAQRFVFLASAGDQNMWRPPSVMERFRSWSQGQHVPSDAEFSFLGAWTRLTQIAFTSGENELITLGSDPFQQIRIWDASNHKLKLASPLPLPLPLAPIFLS